MKRKNFPGRVLARRIKAMDQVLERIRHHTKIGSESANRKRGLALIELQALEALTGKTKRGGLVDYLPEVRQ